MRLMKVVSRLPQLRPQLGDTVTVLVVAAAYVRLFVSVSTRFSLPELALLLAAGIAFAVIGTIGFARCHRIGSLPVTLTYFVVEIALFLIVVAVSQAPGETGLMLLPLAAQTVVVLPRRWMLMVCAVVVMAVAVPTGLASNWQNAVQAAAGYLAGVVFVVAFTYLALREERTRTEVERLAADLREANEKLRAYAVQAEELATTQERNRLAREIHDGLGHYLTAINMQLQAARAVWSSNPPRAADALGKAQTLTREALADVRRSVAALRAAPTENRSLPEALAPLIEESRAAGIQTELIVNGAPRPVSPQAGLALYRAAQEGLTNVRKHAQASRVDLRLDFDEAATICLVVQDDGVGSQQTDGGFGLVGLRERVRHLGGDVCIRTTAGQGFALEVKVPG